MMTERPVRKAAILLIREASRTVLYSSSMLTGLSGCPVAGLMAGRFIWADLNQNHAANSEMAEAMRLRICANNLVSMSFS